VAGEEWGIGAILPTAPSQIEQSDLGRAQAAPAGAENRCVTPPLLNQNLSNNWCKYLKMYFTVSST
jgi:hypothetical protein